MSKQPTATAFTRTQESWAKHLLDMVQARIDDREEALRENGWKSDDFDKDDALMDLYDDELYYIRFIDDMQYQRDYIRTRYLGG